MFVADGGEFRLTQIKTEDALGLMASASCARLFNPASPAEPHDFADTAARGVVADPARRDVLTAVEFAD